MLIGLIDKPNLPNRTHFPRDLAKVTMEYWSSYVWGISIPELPELQLLLTILETAYAASMEREEGRSLQFNVCCIPEHRIKDVSPEDGIFLPFAKERKLAPQEIRRLAPACPSRSSAIWVTWNTMECKLAGMVSINPAWVDSRLARDNRVASLPPSLFVRVQGPGHIQVYQGSIFLAELKGGIITLASGDNALDHLGISEIADEGIKALGRKIYIPEYESPQEWSSFEWITWHNTLLGIVNTIQILGHGGALLVLRRTPRIPSVRSALRIKYPIKNSQSNFLCKSYKAYLDARNRYCDFVSESSFKGYQIIPTTQMEYHTLENQLETASNDFHRGCRTIGAFAGVDGAIVLTNRFELLGFGAEITTSAKGLKVHQVQKMPIQNKLKELDVEQFGMRHRSVMKFCAKVPNSFAYVVSQDGDISLVWTTNGQVMFKKGISTKNTNMI